MRMEGMEHGALPSEPDRDPRLDFDEIWKTFRIVFQARFVKYCAALEPHRETETDQERRARELALMIGFGPWFAEEYGASGERLPEDVQKSLVEMSQSAEGGKAILSPEAIDDLIRESVETPPEEGGTREDARGKIVSFVSKMRAAYVSRNPA